MRIQTYGLSRTAKGGGPNEDCYCIGPFVGQSDATLLEFCASSSFFKRYGLLVAVTDGSSHYGGGEFVGKTFLSLLAEQFYSWSHAGTSAQRLRESVGEYIEVAHRNLQAELAEGGVADARVTLAGVALLDPDTAAVFNVGDARVLRASGGMVRQLSKDHAELPPDKLSENLKDPLQIEKQRRTEPTRWLGLIGKCEPEIRLFTWGEDDIFLAGTKGWHGDGRGIAKEAVKSGLLVNKRMPEFVSHSLDEAHAADGEDDATLVGVKIG